MSKRAGEELETGPSAKQPRIHAPGANGAVTEQDITKRLEGLNAPRVWYKEGRPLKELTLNFRAGVAFVEVAIPAESMTSNNKQVKARQLWGDHTYTDDSDIVAVLMHLGYYAMHNAPQHSTVASFHALVKLLPPKDQYVSCFRNSVRSRAWFARVDGCSYQVEGCWLKTRARGALVALSPSADDGAATTPTFAPSAGDRQVMTRANRPKAVSEVTVLYNLANEPWLKYSMAAVADRGLQPRSWTSARLQAEVLYLETSRERFEVSYSGTAGEGAQQRDTFTLARCKQALPLALMQQQGIPAPASAVEVLETGLTWDDFQWGSLSVRVRGHEFKVARLQFLKQVAAAK